MIKLNKKNNEESYKDEGRHSKWVPNSNFIHEIETHHPLSTQYIRYWKEIKKRCMEGFWSEGKWMPGPLYFYINLCKIKVNKTKFSTTKVVGRPFLRDLEWEKSYVFMESRGFSGFLDDTEETCFNDLKDFDKKSPEDQEKALLDFPEEVFRPDKTLKKYVSARVYLRRIHSKNLGKPLFQNQARNVIDIECRGGGKSYWGANGMILHTYLMDGVYDYAEYRAALEKKDPYAVVSTLKTCWTKCYLGWKTCREIRL